MQFIYYTPAHSAQIGARSCYALLSIEMTPATSRGAALAVAGSLALLMVVTVLLSRAYVHTRISRAEALYDEGIRLAGRGHSAEAAENFRAALVYEHNNEKYRMALARSLMELGRLDEAETRRRRDAAGAG